MGLTSDTAVAVTDTGAFALAALALLAATLHDVAFRTIPNWISVVLLAAGGVVRILGGTLVPGLTAAVLVFLGAAFCWHRGWLGGGDVKLLAAATLLVPPVLAVNLLLDVALAGGILALLYLALARLVAPPSGAARPAGLFHRICRTERYRISRHQSLPYASAIAAGAFLALLKG